MKFWDLFGNLGFHMEFRDLFSIGRFIWKSGFSYGDEDFIRNFGIYFVICDLFGILGFQMGFLDLL